MRMSGRREELRRRVSGSPRRCGLRIQGKGTAFTGRDSFPSKPVPLRTREDRAVSKHRLPRRGDWRRGRPPRVEANVPARRRARRSAVARRRIVGRTRPRRHAEREPVCRSGGLRCGLPRLCPPRPRWPGRGAAGDCRPDGDHAHADPACLRVRPDQLQRRHGGRRRQRYDHRDRGRLQRPQHRQRPAPVRPPVRHSRPPGLHPGEPDRRQQACRRPTAVGATRSRWTSSGRTPLLPGPTSSWSRRTTTRTQT